VVVPGFFLLPEVFFVLIGDVLRAIAILLTLPLVLIIACEICHHINTIQGKGLLETQ
jgi:hypothetical protein